MRQIKHLGFFGIWGPDFKVTVSLYSATLFIFTKKKNFLKSFIETAYFSRKMSQQFMWSLKWFLEEYIFYYNKSDPT